MPRRPDLGARRRAKPRTELASARNPQLRPVDNNESLCPDLAGRRCGQPHAWIAIEAGASNDRT
jgi:hypothetical protein